MIEKTDDPFIKINRKMMDDLLDTFSERLKPSARNVWIYLLMYANWGYGDSLKRGQIFIGRKQLSIETCITEQTARTVLKQLENGHFLAEKSNQQSNQQLTSRVTNKGTVLSIENYDSWVCFEKETNQQSNQQLTSRVTTSVQKEKRIKEKTLDAKASLSACADVSKIFEVYGKKINAKSRLTAGAKKKIETRLKTFSVDDLILAMENFSKDGWWMENNAHRGLAWFFENDDRIDQFLNLQVRFGPGVNGVAGVAQEAPIGQNPAYQEFRPPVKKIGAPPPIKKGNVSNG